MKIGYFVGHFPYINLLHNPDYNKKYAHGGTEIAAHNLALKMGERGHEINVFTTSMKSSDSVEFSEGMHIYRYGTNLKIASANLSLNLMYKPLKNDVDIVHALYNIPYPDLSASRYSKKKKVPFIITYQADAQNTGGNLIRNAATSIYNRYLLPKVLSSADIIIATSPSYIDKSRYLGKYRDKIVVIPNGINLENFDINFSKEESRIKLELPLNEEIILFFGNIVQYKGPDILLKAFSLVKKGISNAKVKLVFVGRGDMQEELKDLAKKLDLEEHVKFVGYIEEDLKPLYFKAADIFCLPSVTLAEAFGIVNLEAMACGIPVISTKLGGIPDIVNHGKNGLIIEPGNIKALADALTYLLENEDVRKKMGECGKKMVVNYSWKKIAEKTEKVYQDVLDI